MWLSSIGNFAHTVGCLQYWLPSVFTNGTIGNNGITNGTIGKTLNDIGIPLEPLVETMNARIESAVYSEMRNQLERLERVPRSMLRAKKKIRKISQIFIWKF